MNIIVKYGAVDQIAIHSDGDKTIGDILNDQSIRAELGFSDNVKALICGVEQPNSAIVPDGATVVIETRCNTKATREYDLDLIAA